MRSDDDALELFFRDVGERKDGPVALVVFGAGTHLDAPADAVCACGRRDLEGLALIGIDFRRRGQIERGVVAGNLHGLRRLRNACSQCKHRQEKSCNHRDQSAGR